MSERGKYIVIEGGGEGIGKSTQSSMLVDHMNDVGIASTYVHEPGAKPDRMSNEVEDIMEFITKSKDVELTPHEAFLAFTLARSATYRKKIQPALESGTSVVTDRNWLSSVVYQGYADGIGMHFVRDETAKFLPNEYLYPDFTVRAFASEEHRTSLLASRGGSENDYFESREDAFQRRIKEGYDKIDSSFIHSQKKIGSHAVQSSKYVSFDGTPEEVHARVWSTVEEHVLSDVNQRS